MGKKVVLISGIGGDIGQTIAHVLRDDFILIGIDMHPFMPFKHFVDIFYEIPAANDASYLNAVKEIILKERIDHFIPVPEAELRVLQQNRPVWAAWPVSVLINNENILTSCLDKYLTVALLKQLGLPFPRTVFLKAMDIAQWDYPFIVKAKESCGSRQVWVVKNAADLQYVKSFDRGNLIVQELLSTPQEEYTTGVFSDGSKTSSISFKRVLGYGGLSKEVLLVKESALEEMAGTLAQGTGLRGSMNIQSRKVGDRFVPFEINPRISSTVGFRYAFGFRDVHWSLALGMTPEYSYVPQYKSGRGYRVFKEIYDGMEVI